MSEKLSDYLKLCNLEKKLWSDDPDSYMSGYIQGKIDMIDSIIKDSYYEIVRLRNIDNKKETS